MIVPQWLIDWVIETIQRLRMKRPKYFLYLSRFGDIATMLTGLPYILVQIENTFAVSFPYFLTAFSNKLALGIGLGFSLASRLTVKSTVVAQTTEGSAITVMDKTNMPFTEKSEAKDIKEAAPPPPVVDEVPEPDQSVKGD